MAMRRITKLKKNKVEISRDDWFKLLAMLREALGTDKLEGQAQARGGGGGCDDFCSDACEGHGGCDFGFGGGGECGAACNDGEVFLELEV